MYWYSLGADLLDRSSAEKHLGVQLDSRLAMSQQCVPCPRRPVISWDALQRLWPAGRGR